MSSSIFSLKTDWQNSINIFFLEFWNKCSIPCNRSMILLLLRQINYVKNNLGSRKKGNHDIRQLSRLCHALSADKKDVENNPEQETRIYWLTASSKAILASEIIEECIPFNRDSLKKSLLVPKQVNLRKGWPKLVFNKSVKVSQIYDVRR